MSPKMMKNRPTRRHKNRSNWLISRTKVGVGALDLWVTLSLLSSYLPFSLALVSCMDFSSQHSHA